MLVGKSPIEPDNEMFYTNQMNQQHNRNVYFTKICYCLNQFFYPRNGRLICFRNDSKIKFVDCSSKDWSTDMPYSQTFSYDGIEFESLFIIDPNDKSTILNTTSLIEKSQAFFVDSDLYFDYITNLGYSKSKEIIMDINAALLIDFNVGVYFTLCLSRHLFTFSTCNVFVKRSKHSASIKFGLTQYQRPKAFFFQFQTFYEPNRISVKISVRYVNTRKTGKNNQVRSGF
jgi:hypothetical protein